MAIPPDATASRRNEFLDAGFSGSDSDPGYDSEAAEHTKTGAKRRKLTSRRHAVSNEEDDDDDDDDDDDEKRHVAERKPTQSKGKDESPSTLPTQPPGPAIGQTSKPSKSPKPGVVYLSSLPPYLKPSALRNLLTQRGFSPITRLFLAPSSKAKDHHSAKKSSRQLYAEGWIEFASKKIAKRCTETLNATTVGGRKGGYYHDDVWNMKYLRGVGWHDLMAQVREEKREEEVRRIEERGQIARETKQFVEAVERAKVGRGMERSRAKKRGRGREGKGEGGIGAEAEQGGAGDTSEKGAWRQYRVHGVGGGAQHQDDDAAAAAAAVPDDVKRVLSKIF